MRFVSTGFHGVIDYLTALVLIASPWLFGFKGYDLFASAVPITVGSVMLCYSMFTSYELGFTRSGLSMRAHLWLDAIAGIFLMVSPWALGFADDVSRPHLIIGASELLFALITKNISTVERNNNRNKGERRPGSAGTPSAGGAGDITVTPKGTASSL
jgi:hypothetical protein